MPQLHLANRAQRRRALRPHMVVPSFAMGEIDCLNALVLIEKLSQVTRDSGLIVGVGNDQ